MMEMLDLIKKRRSMRFYTDKPIAREDVKKLVEAACWGPNGHRIYSQRILIIQGKDLIRRVKAVSPGLHGNPTTIIVISTDKKREKEVAENYIPIGREEEVFFKDKSKAFLADRVRILSIMNGSIAAQNICLAATALGIGSCIIYGFDPDRLKQLLELPENIFPQLYISLGYPDQSAQNKFSRSVPRLPFRRSIKDMVIGWK